MKTEDTLTGQNEVPIPIKDCPSCQGTGGIYSCPVHSPNNYIREQPKPFVHVHLRCPWCGKDMEFEGYKSQDHPQQI